jgi:hypothetical protein
MGVGVGVTVGNGVEVGVSVGVAVGDAQAVVSKIMSKREAVILVMKWAAVDMGYGLYRVWCFCTRATISG